MNSIAGKVELLNGHETLPSCFGMGISNTMSPRRL